MSDTKKDPEQKNILQLYAAFGAALVLSLIPSITAALVSMLLFLGVLIAAYVVRSKADNASLADNHTTFIIRTTWIGGLYALITMIIGSVYMLLNVDNTPLDGCINTLFDMAMNPELLNPETMMSAFQPCINRYLDVNSRVFLISGIVIIAPVLTFFILRYIRGLKRAIGGYRVAKHNSWL